MRNVSLTYKSFWTPLSRFYLKKEVHFLRQTIVVCLSSLVSFSPVWYEAEGVWLDLHASDFEGNVLTEYEQSFQQRAGYYRVEAVTLIKMLKSLLSLAF